MLDCLIGSVGVTNTDCGCLINGLDQETKDKLAESASGLYIDRLPNALNFISLKDVSACANFAKLSLAALDDAIRLTGDELIVKLSEVGKEAAKNYIGSIGRAAYTKTLQNTRNIQGVYIAGNERTDGTITVSKIRIVGNINTTMNLKVVRSFEGDNDFEEIKSIEFGTIGNNYSTIVLDVPLVLPLGKDLRPYEYFIYWDKTEVPAFFAKDNEFNCSTCDANTPVLNSYATIKGFSSNDTNFLNYSTDGYSHGLVLTVEINCKSEVVICREYNTKEALNVSVNYAIMYMANAILIQKVLDTNEINRYTMKDRESLWGKRNAFQSKFNNNIAFVISKIDVSNSDCFICKPTSMFKGKVVS